MLKLNYFLADIFILSAEKQPIKLSWRKIECLQVGTGINPVPPTRLCRIICFPSTFREILQYCKGSTEVLPKKYSGTAEGVLALIKEL